jgi:hypothetical protein
LTPPGTRAFWLARSPSCALSGRRETPVLRLQFLPSCAPRTFSASLSGRPSVGWEKRAVGDMWAERSNGKAVFLMVTQKILGEIQNAARANA